VHTSDYASCHLHLHYV